MTTVHTWSKVSSEQIINGDFTGNANGWGTGGGAVDSLAAGFWAYNSNNVIHIPGVGNDTALGQPGILTEGGIYTVSLTIGGTIGTVGINLGGNSTEHVYSAGAGTVSFTDIYSNVQDAKIYISPSEDFNGTIDNVSILGKPTTSWTAIPLPIFNVPVTEGFAYGLLMAITRPVTTPGGDIWTRISKAQ